MTAGYEPIHMSPKMPFGELARMMLLGGSERMSAQRAYEIGMVSEICPSAELHERVEWAAGHRGLPSLGIQGTVRALWAGRDLSRRQAHRSRQLPLPHRERSA